MDEHLDLLDLRHEKRKLNAARERYEIFLAERWPIGSAIHWLKGGHPQSGEVQHHGREGFRVRNYHTDKSYWIDSYDVEQYLESVCAEKAA